MSPKTSTAGNTLTAYLVTAHTLHNGFIKTLRKANSHYVVNHLGLTFKKLWYIFLPIQLSCIDFGLSYHLKFENTVVGNSKIKLSVF